MTATLPPMIRFQPLVAGAPLPGGKVYFYAAGTLTPQSAYAADGTTPLANPLTLDANGATDFRLGDLLAYKINLTDSTGGQAVGWPVDQITSQNAAVAGVISDLASTAFGKGDALIGTLQPSTGALPRTQHDKNADRISVFDYMTPSQIADVRSKTASIPVPAAVQSALLNNDTVVMPAGKYLFDTTVNLKTNQHLICEGAEIIMTTNAITPLGTFNTHDWQISGKLKITGFNPVVSEFGLPVGYTGGGSGIAISDSFNWSISGVSIDRMGGNGLYVSSTVEASQPGPGDAFAYVSDCTFERNGYGVLLTAGFMSEYITFSNCISRANAASGVRVGSGNIAWGDGVIVDNKIGVEVLTGFNHAHGTFHGAMINHNIDNAISCTDVWAGMLFTACTIFDSPNANPTIGSILLTRSTGITFTGCMIACNFNVIADRHDQINKVSDCNFGWGGGGGRTYDVYGTSGFKHTLVFRGCYQAEHTSVFGLNAPSESDCLAQANVDQAMTNAVPLRVQWQLNSVEHGYRIYDGTNYNFKIVEPGMYDVIANIQLVGTTLPASGMYGYIAVNAVIKRYFVITDFQTTDAFVQVASVLDLAQNNVVDIYVVTPSGTVSLKSSSTCFVALKS